MFDYLFRPIKIGGITLENRFVTTAMEACYCGDEAGFVTDRHIAYMVRRAQGGWGMLTSEMIAISPEAVPYLHCSGLWDDRQVAGHKRMNDAIHAQGNVKTCAQIGHGGRQTGRATSGMEPIAPTNLLDPTRAENSDDIPREMTKADIARVIHDFAMAARRAKEGGYDAVEIHGAHGYLVHQFLSPFSNKRTDEYGGSLRNRARFACEVIQAIRKQVGPGFPIIMRMSVSELMDAGRLTVGDTRALAMIFEDAGADCLNTSVGAHATKGMYPVCPSALPHGYNIDYAEEIHRVVSIPVMGSGRFNDPYMVEAALRAGKADIIAMGRASLADPDFPNKVKNGEIDDIRQCIGCIQACISNLKKNARPIQCLVNPELGMEQEYTWEPADTKRKVAVIGAGIAGMGAAIAAARRGHDVTVYEKSDRPGGQWLLAAVPPFKQELTTLTVWQTRQMDKYHVKLLLNTEFNVELARKEKFDVILVATGAAPIIPKIPGVEQDNVMTAADVLARKINPGKHVAVIGGGQVGCETAAFLAQQNKIVTILEMLPSIPTEGIPGVNFYLTEDLDQHNVVRIPNARVLEFAENSVIYQSSGAQMQVDGIDSFVLALGVCANASLAQELQGCAERVIIIGDANHPGKGMDAHAEGFRTGYYI